MLKVQPLGGIRNAHALAAHHKLPVVVSSALESAVGINYGITLAASFEEMSYDCGLGTGSLLAKNVAEIPVVDFVKIDVEGAEENILRNSTYLKKVKYLDIEFHDDLRSLETVSRICKECFPNHRVMFYNPENAFLEKVSAGLTFKI
jgi:hypothetical protein